LPKKDIDQRMDRVLKWSNEMSMSSAQKRSPCFIVVFLAWEICAGLATAAREHRLQVQRERLGRGRQLTGAALQERWREPACCAAWIDTAVAAARVLEPGAWEVRYAPGPSAEALQGLAAGLQQLAGEAPALRLDETLDAGVVINAPYIELDLSAAGLLRDRVQVDGLLLQTLLELEAERDGSG
jgi:hypothetical protein